MSDYTKRLAAQQANQPYQYGQIPNTTTQDLPLYGGALSDYSQMMKQFGNLYGQAMPGIQSMGSYYTPGGSYGQSQRQQAQENVAGGVANDMANAVGSGMSSTALARGLNTRAGSELSKLYGNIEDTRAGLQLQSQQAQNQAYMQMMQAQIAAMNARPTYPQNTYVQPKAKSNPFGPQAGQAGYPY